jgi:hypothetical protein
MALKDATQTQTAINAPFEDEDDAMTETTSTAANEAAEAVASTAIAQAQTTAVAAARPKMQAAYAEFQDVFDADTVGGMALSVPTIKGEQGGAYVGEKLLGTRFRIEVISWNYRWMITSGLQSKDGGYEESKQYIANSYDNQTVHGKDMSVDEYLQMLREAHGYDKAGKSQYIDLFGLVTWTEKGGDIAPEDRELHRVQLSQTSAGNFAAFCATQGVMVSRGIVKELSSVIEFEAVARSKGTNKYTNFSMRVAM